MHGGNEITFAAIDNHPKCSASRFVFDTEVATIAPNEKRRPFRSVLYATEVNQEEASSRAQPMKRSLQDHFWMGHCVKRIHRQDAVE